VIFPNGPAALFGVLISHYELELGSVNIPNENSAGDKGTSVGGKCVDEGTDNLKTMWLSQIPGYPKWQRERFPPKVKIQLGWQPFGPTWN
jgi:hypothetical protein